MNLIRIVVVAAVAVLGGGPPPAALAASPPPAPPALQTVALGPSRPAARTVANPGGTGAGPQSTQPFSLVGATWADPRAPLRGSVEVRTRSVGGGRWSPWRALESDEPDAADPGTEPAGQRGSTDPLWTGPSDGVEARVVSSDGTSRGLPAGLRLDLINPDASPTPTPTPRSESARSTVPPRAIPPYVSRAGWRADESIVDNAPEYTDDVQVFFVHHTATGNNYSCAQSASIVRGIELYHVRSRGWNDIGYNFLVDRCGTLFEGRAGGVTRPVLGAHTLGFNEHASAVAVIGDYDGVAVSPAVRTVIAEVASYKLGAYGNRPAGTVALISNGSDRYPRGARVTLNRISGHRDTGKTECPGNTLYGQLPAIRSLAASAPALSWQSIPGAQPYGSRWFTTGAIRPTWRLSSPSRLIDRFEVLVDGTVTHYLRGGFRTQALTLTPGRHTVAVRAVAQNGRVSTISASVYADATAPTFSRPAALSLRTGPVRSLVPAQVTWAVADQGGVARLGLGASRFGPERVTWPVAMAQSRPTTFTVLAADRAGNIARSPVTGTVTSMPETATTRTGTWTSARSSAFVGGTAGVTRTVGSTMSWSFTGRAAQLVVSTGRGFGRLAVTVDGAPAGTVGLRSAAAANGMAVWAPQWSSTGAHTISIRLTGTPYAIVDGLTVLH